MRQASNFDSGWPVALVFGLMGVYVLALTQTGQKLGAEILSSLPSVHGPLKPLPPSRPEVLVVTANSEDTTRVAGTVNPRGFQVVVADCAADAGEILRSDATRIGVVVIDIALPEAQIVADLARQLIPAAKVIRLRPNHGATDLAVLLLGAI